MSLLKTSLFSCLLLCLINLGYSQDTITVTLLVDTENFNPDDSNSSCSFKAVWSKSGKVVKSNGDLENFEIDVFIDDIIIWEGRSTTNDVVVDIKKVVRENNTKIFNSKRHYGKKRGDSNKNTVEAKILYKTVGKPDYKYKIFYRINKSGKTYKIDPKIKVGTKT